MNIGNRNQIQGNVNNSNGQRLYMELENLIFDHAGVQCTVYVRTPGHISIRTKDYADFLIAKSVIKGRTSKEILRDFETLEVVK